jgi:hypothetical protein
MTPRQKAAAAAETEPEVVDVGTEADAQVNVPFADDLPPGAGDAVDAAIPVDDDRGSVVPFRREDKGKRDRDPKSGPPRLDEWQDFISRLILKTLTDAYVDMLFRDIDDRELTEREVSKLYLRDEERDRIAKPVSELLNKVEFTRKHGRAIIAAAGSGESVWTLAMWFMRVNRIANRHRSDSGPAESQASNGYPRSNPAATNGGNPSNGKRDAAVGYTIIQPGTG